MTKDLKALRIDQDRKQPASPGGRKLRPLGLAILAGLLFGAAAYYYLNARTSSVVATESATTSAAGQPAPGTSESSSNLIVSGYVVAHHKIQVGSKVMGKVSWIGVERGDQVAKGQLLVKLDDREYRARLEEAEAALRAAEAHLKELEAGSREEEIARARAELERAEAQRKNDQMELQRLDNLLKTGAVSQKAVDDARTRLEIAEAAARVAQKNYELIKLGPRAEQILLARAEVDRARAALKYAQTMLEATEIRAPVAGTVLQRLVEMGEMVTTSFAGEMGAKSAVVALADLNDLQVELDISQSDFKRISQAQECLMSPEAYPDRQYRCEIAEIAPEANRQKATIQVKVKVLSPDQYLRPEMNARVTFQLEKSS